MSDTDTVERVAIAMWNADAPERMKLEPEAVDSDLARKYWRLSQAAIAAMPAREVTVQEAAKVLLEGIISGRDDYARLLKDQPCGGFIGLRASLRALAGGEA